MMYPGLETVGNAASKLAQLRYFTYCLLLSFMLILLKNNVPICKLSILIMARGSLQFVVAQDWSLMLLAISVWNKFRHSSKPPWRVLVAHMSAWCRND